MVGLWVVACGGTGGAGAPGGTGDGGGSAGQGEVPGAPANEGNGQVAVGAPIMIPRFQQDQGRPLDEVRAEIDSAIREQCGDGELCVTLRVEPRDDSFSMCEFVETDPAQDSEVERGSTVVIVAGTNPCSEPSSPAGGEQPTEDAAATEDSPPQPPTSS